MILESPTCEVVHETKLTSQISFPTDSLLAQWVEHGPDDLEVVGCGNFELCQNSTVMKMQMKSHFIVASRMGNIGIYGDAHM